MYRAIGLYQSRTTTTMGGARFLEMGGALGFWGGGVALFSPFLSVKREVCHLDPGPGFFVWFSTVSRL